MTDSEIQELVVAQLRAANVPQKAKFDPTVNLGHLLTMATIIGAGFLGYLSFHDSARDLRYDVDGNKKQITELREAVRSMAESNSRLTSSLEKLTWIVDSIQKGKTP